MKRLIIFLFCFISFPEVNAQQKTANMYVTINTPTNKKENSISFYQKLGFKQADDNELMFTDGKVVIEINTQKSSRAGINLYKADWKAEVAVIEMTKHVVKTKTGFALTDPSGVWIYLIEGEYKGLQPEGKSLSELGNSQGLTLETADMEASAKLYQQLGFSLVAGDPKKGYAVLATENGFGISLLGSGMCPHLFFNPSLTYFNGKKNLAIIEKIRQLDIDITQEITEFNKQGIVDNVIIRDPGGYGFFIFSDEAPE